MPKKIISGLILFLLVFSFLAFRPANVHAVTSINETSITSVRITFGITADDPIAVGTGVVKVFRDHDCTGTEFATLSLTDVSPSSTPATAAAVWNSPPVSKDYSAQLVQVDSSGSIILMLSNCLNGRTLDPPPPGAQCINYVSLEPPETSITPSSDITIKYSKNSASSPNNYKVEVFNSNNNIVKTVNELSESGDNWVGNIGSLSGPNTVYSAKLFSKAPLFLCNSKTIAVLDSGEGNFPDDSSEGGFLSGRTKELVNLLVSFAIGIAGGVAFLLLIYGGFKFMFSMGNPENVQQGREVITAAIIGLLVVVFSVFLLRLIGISILGIPL